MTTTLGRNLFDAPEEKVTAALPKICIKGTKLMLHHNVGNITQNPFGEFDSSSVFSDQIAI